MDDMRRKRKRRTGRPAGGDRVVAAGPLFRRVFATFKDATRDAFSCVCPVHAPVYIYGA